MSSCSVRCLLLLLAVAACYISVSNAHSRRCCSGRLPDGKTTNLTCTRPTPYCCRSRHPLKPVFCCSDCRKGVDYDDCERDDDDDDHHGYWKYKYYWKYSSVDYPKNVDVAPEWQQPPKMPPGYFDVFTVTPPPDYKERPESA
uniref:Secreted protein n=1 Tax=Macrostomum lignano TaxID=282301 RepID=A0A1I8HQ10_9PLAT